MITCPNPCRRSKNRGRLAKGKTDNDKKSSKQRRAMNYYDNNIEAERELPGKKYPSFYSAEEYQ
jgi:hypothetical protein